MHHPAVDSLVHYYVDGEIYHFLKILVNDQTCYCLVVVMGKKKNKSRKRNISNSNGKYSNSFLVSTACQQSGTVAL